MFGKTFRDFVILILIFGVYFIGSLFFLAFSIFYFINVFSIKKMPGGHFEVMTASTFPYYIGIAGIIISILILIFEYGFAPYKSQAISYFSSTNFS